MADPSPPGTGSAPGEGAGGTSGGRGMRRALTRELWAFLELLALCGFVVVQPLLEIIGGSPDFFIFHGVSGAEIGLLVACFTLVPPLVLWGLGAVAGLAGRPARGMAHLVTVGALFILFMIQIGKHVTSLRGVVLLLIALVLATVILAGYLRFDPVRQMLRFAAVGPLVFVLLFTFASPSSAVVLAAGVPATGGVGRVTGPNPPIVMIVFDELPLLSLLDQRGGIEADRFPHFARLAADATWWRNATAVSGWTPYALPAMLTGTWPARHVAPHYSQYPDNLFSLLGDAYRIEAHESIAQLCPPWYCGDLAERSSGGLPAAFGETSTLLAEILSPLDPVRERYGDFAEPTVTERLGTAAAAGQLGPEFRFNQVGANQPARFRDFVEQLRRPVPADRPTLHFLHLLLPHTPWTYLPSGMRYQSVPLPVDGEWWGRLALQRMELQLEYTDLLLGEILHALDETGRYQDALVVVTADHGVNLTPGGAGSRQLGPGDRGAEELAWVPLFIKAPGQAGGILREDNWQHVDLLPTLADLAGVEVPWQVDGISWTGQQRQEPEKTYYSELDDVRVLDGRLRYRSILADPGAFPALPPAPLPDLTGTAVSGYPVVDGPAGAEVAGLDAFADVRPAGGTVPALVHGTVPAGLAEGTPLAIAVNGRIGAVVPVVAGGGDIRRFAGLVADEHLFRSGENRLELFVVLGGGAGLQRLPLR